MDILKDAFIQKLINNAKSPIIIILPNKSKEGGENLKKAFEERLAKLTETIRKLRAEKKQSNQPNYATQRGYSMSDFFATMG